ncbi:MAG: hypothetical protein JWL89_634 [Candidatus Saccharibacteria bacterium]|nr:hypothetical protein [Candidatus Saccharibacteria bacterium]
MSENDPYFREITIPPLPELNEDYLPNNASVHFHLTAHSLAEHVAGLQQLYDEADVFIPEMYGWTAKSLRDWNAISKGERKTYVRYQQTPSADSHGGFTNALLDLTYRKYKPIRFIDDDARDSPKKSAAKLWQAQTTEQALQALADQTADDAQDAVRRNIIMAEKLGPTVSGAIEANPKLRNKDDVKVLVFIGSLHELLYDYFRTNPATHHKVSASHLAGLSNADADVAIHKRIETGKAPRRSDLVTYLVTMALCQVQIPSIRSGYLVELTDIVQVKPDQEVLAARQLIKLMAQDIDNPEVEDAILRACKGRGKPANIIQDYALKARELSAQDAARSSILERHVAQTHS